MDLRQAGFTTVMFALGYSYDFAWLKCLVLVAPTLGQ